MLDVFNKNSEKEFTIPELQSILKIGRSSLKTELEILWNLGVITKDIRNENIGGYVTTDNYGHEQIRGGRWQEISYYKMIEKETQIKLRGLDE